MANVKEKKEVSANTVELKPIKRTNWLPESHDGYFRYTGAQVYLCAQRNTKTGVMNTGLTEEDERHLETTMHLKPGELNKYNMDFWGDHKRSYLAVPKEGMTLNLDIPKHMMWYKICLVNSNVAKSEAEVPDKPTAIFVLTNPEVVAKEQNKKDSVERKAALSFAGLTSEDKRDVLAIYCIKTGTREGRPTRDSSEDWIDTILYKRLKDNPELFLEITLDPDRTTIATIDKFVNKKIWSVDRGKYFIYGTTDLVGANLNEAIEYYKDPYNNAQILEFRKKLDQIV